MAGGALQGVRVLDLSGEPGQFCGKLMGDLGAEVIKIEPPAGDDVRRLGPFCDDVEDVNRSLYWHAMNTSKQAITLNLEIESTGPPGPGGPVPEPSSIAGLALGLGALAWHRRRRG
jgi:crotonobetainyl-CoA:carnitine CoA-transferase CaiB-like acyl-CoA transferase